VKPSYGRLLYYCSDNRDDGQDCLLAFLFPTAAEFIEWAEDYFERELPVQPTEAVYAGAKASPDIISSINPERDPQAIMSQPSWNLR
jgi:hypothetical protein